MILATASWIALVSLEIIPVPPELEVSVTCEAQQEMLAEDHDSRAVPEATEAVPIPNLMSPGDSTCMKDQTIYQTNLIAREPVKARTHEIDVLTEDGDWKKITIGTPDED